MPLKLTLRMQPHSIAALDYDSLSLRAVILAVCMLYNGNTLNLISNCLEQILICCLTYNIRPLGFRLCCLCIVNLCLRCRLSHQYILPGTPHTEWPRLSFEHCMSCLSNLKTFITLKMVFVFCNEMVAEATVRSATLIYISLLFIFVLTVH